MSTGEWISVKDRLPPIKDEKTGVSGRVIVFLKGTNRDNIEMALLFYNSYGTPNFWSCHQSGIQTFEYGVCTHWMPMPLPPKPEN
jgi:hypothetical protein